MGETERRRLTDYAGLDNAYIFNAGRVPGERWAKRPYEGANPVTFCVWRMARSEDSNVNVRLLRGRSLYAEGWSDKLGVGPAQGTGFSDADVDKLASELNPDVLDAYWHEVRSRTRAWLESISDEDLNELLDRTIDVDSSEVTEPGLFVDSIAQLVKDVQRGNKGEYFLRWSIIGHQYSHFAEIGTIASALGYPGL